MLASILIFVLVLSVLVLVHELGHFLAAKKAGIPVLEFGLGLPILFPKIWSIRIGETIYAIYPVLFGGFVRLLGENEEENKTKNYPESQYFINKPKLVRAGVVVAGIAMNFLLAIVAFAVVYSSSGIPRDTHQLKIVNISADSPAQSAGMIVGDVVTKVGKENITSVDSFINIVNSQKGKNTVFEIQRTVNNQKSTVDIQVVPRLNPPEGEGALGVTITTTEIYFPPVWQRPFRGIAYGLQNAYDVTKTVVLGLFGIAQQASQGHAPSGVVGPVGLFAVVDYIRRLGWMYLVDFVGILSINLAVINILPIPALDGGRLLFIEIESVIGKRISSKTEATIHTIGFVILLFLLLMITAGDIKKFITGGLGGIVSSLIK